MKEGKKKHKKNEPRDRTGQIIKGRAWWVRHKETKVNKHKTEEYMTTQGKWTKRQDGPWHRSSLNVQDSSIPPTQSVSSDLTCQWPQTTHPLFKSHLCSVASMTTDEARTNMWAHSEQTLKVHFFSPIIVQSEKASALCDNYPEFPPPPY